MRGKCSCARKKNKNIKKKRPPTRTMLNLPPLLLRARMPMCMPRSKLIIDIGKVAALMDGAGPSEADRRDGDLVERSILIRNQTLLVDLLAGLPRVGFGADVIDEGVHVGFCDAEEAGRDWGLAAGVGVGGCDVLVDWGRWGGVGGVG